jgi:hypothetical protein
LEASGSQLTLPTWKRKNTIVDREDRRHIESESEGKLSGNFSGVEAIPWEMTARKRRYFIVNTSSTPFENQF